MYTFFYRNEDGYLAILVDELNELEEYHNDRSSFNFFTIHPIPEKADKYYFTFLNFLEVEKLKRVSKKTIQQNAPVLFKLTESFIHA